jgi:hypothetical protein
MYMYSFLTLILGCCPQKLFIKLNLARFRLATWLNRLLCLPLALVILLWFAVPASFAQDVSPPNASSATVEEGSPIHTSLTSADISSEKVGQFVTAYLQITVLLERREGELQAVETESESLRVQQEIESEAFAIIEASGLSWQEYLQLLGLANTDPDFGERIAAQLQELGR